MGLMISDVAIRQPRHRDAALAVRVTESQLATAIRTARAFSYRPSYKPSMNGSYTRSGVASVPPIRRFSFGGSPFPVRRFLCSGIGRDQNTPWVPTPTQSQPRLGLVVGCGGGA